MYTSKMVVVLTGTLLMVVNSASADCCMVDTCDDLIDLTYPFNNETIYWPDSQNFSHTIENPGLERSYYFESWNYAAAEHGGTHIDAPVHYAQGKWSLDQIPLSRLMGELCLVDVKQQVEKYGADYRITKLDVQTWESRNGAIDGCIVAFRTGYGEKWPDFEAYMGTPLIENRTFVEQNLHFPGLSGELAVYLVTKKIKGVGIDTASLDYGQSVENPVHRTLLKENIYFMENLAHLDKIQVARGCSIVALPMNIGHGSGGPLRAVAYGCSGANRSAMPNSHSDAEL